MGTRLAATHDGRGGSIPARTDAVDPQDEVDASRLAITTKTIAEAMITYPALTLGAWVASSLAEP